MPTASTAKKVTTPRKRRTRKTSSTVKKSSNINSVPLNTSTTKVAAMTEKKVETVATKRPEKPNLSFKDYADDIRVRLEIHNYEVNELWQDSKNFYEQNVKPFTLKTVKYVKESYNKAFDVKEENEKQDN